MTEIKDAHKRGKAARNKGKRGERELASILRSYGYDARRGQQFCGANGDADVVGLPGIHIEVKRTEKFKLYDAMSQSIHDAKDDEKPTVMHRRNNCDWIVCMRLEDWIELYREWNNGR
jgi:hypothetical protein